MDLFTHMLLGYLVGWASAWTFTGYNEHLLLLPVVTSMLPDLDVFLHLIPRRIRGRLRGVRHRGFTHSITFIIAGSFVVAWVFHLVFGTDLILGAVLGPLGGATHILADLLTSFSIPALAPLTWREFSLDIDGAVTWYMIPYSLISIIGMWTMRSSGVHISTFTLALTIIMGGIGLHYALRLGVKAYVERVRYRGWRIVPTVRPLSFYLTRLQMTNSRLLLREYVHVRFSPSGKDVHGRKYFEVGNASAPPPGPSPPENVYDAVALTSSHLAATPGWTAMRDAAAMPLTSGEGTWDIFWFDWKDWRPMRETSGLLIRIGADGEISTRPEAHRILW